MCIQKMCIHISVFVKFVFVCFFESIWSWNNVMIPNFLFLNWLMCWIVWYFVTHLMNTINISLNFLIAAVFLSDSWTSTNTNTNNCFIQQNIVWHIWIEFKFKCTWNIKCFLKFLKYFVSSQINQIKDPWIWY